MNFRLDKADLKTSLQGSAPNSDLSPGKRPGLRPRLDGLVAGVAPLPADQVGEEHDEDQPRQGAARPQDRGTRSAPQQGQHRACDARRDRRSAPRRAEPARPQGRAAAQRPSQARNSRAALGAGI